MAEQPPKIMRQSELYVYNWQYFITINKNIIYISQKILDNGTQLNPELAIWSSHLSLFRTVQFPIEWSQMSLACCQLNQQRL